MAKEEIQENENIHRFILLDESVVTYGLRVLIDGVDISQFKRNPVFLSYHFDDKLPIGRCVNVWKENKQILIEVEFDDQDTDEEVQRIIGKVKRGFIKMVSAGLADMIFSDDKKLKLEGQTLPTVIQCRLREASIVGIGANHNALRLYDTEDKEIDLTDEIKLADFIKPIKIDKKMNEELLKLLNLSDKADENAVLIAVRALHQEKVELADKLTKLEEAEKKVKQAEAIALVDEAVRTGKINDNTEKSVSKKLLELFDNDHEGTKQLLAGLPVRQSVTGQIANVEQGNKTELADLLVMSWDELDKSGKLITLKDKNIDVYKDKYKERFGVEPSL